MPHGNTPDFGRCRSASSRREVASGTKHKLGNVRGGEGVLQLIWVITTRPPGPTRLVPFPFFFTAANFPPMSNPRFSLLSPLSKHHPLGYIPYVGLGHISANGLEVGREREGMMATATAFPRSENDVYVVGKVSTRIDILQKTELQAVAEEKRLGSRLLRQGFAYGCQTEVSD